MVEGRKVKERGTGMLETLGQDPARGTAVSTLKLTIQFLLPLKIVPPYTVSSATSSLTK